MRHSKGPYIYWIKRRNAFTRLRLRYENRSWHVGQTYKSGFLELIDASENRAVFKVIGGHLELNNLEVKK